MRGKTEQLSTINLTNRREMKTRGRGKEVQSRERKEEMIEGEKNRVLRRHSTTDKM